MTYKTRQEVLRAAADWMDVCEKAGVEAVCKWTGIIKNVDYCAFDNPPEQYEFPLALLEGKEVWVGSELYSAFFDKTFEVVGSEIDPSGDVILCKAPFGRTYIGSCSWLPPKPATMMVELELEIVEHAAKLRPDISPALTLACKKALENLK